MIERARSFRRSVVGWTLTAAGMAIVACAFVLPPEIARWCGLGMLIMIGGLFFLSRQ